MADLSDLTTLLAAGAKVAFRPNNQVVPVAERSMIEAYDSLKEMLRERYPQVEVDSLDVGPGNAERQAQLDAQLRASGALQDGNIKAQVQILREEILKHAPQALDLS